MACVVGVVNCVFGVPLCGAKAMLEGHAVHSAAKEAAVGLVEEREAHAQLQGVWDQDVGWEALDGVHGEPVSRGFGQLV